MRRRERSEKVTFNRELPLGRAELRARNQEHVFRAFAERQYFGSVYFEVVLSEHSRDRVQQSQTVSGDHRQQVA